MNAADLNSVIFLQIFVILAACRATGWILKRLFDQPQVMGEMIAGILLGPSLLGFYFPEFQTLLFPPQTRIVLHFLSQLGIGLYMFVVGLQFRADHFRGTAQSAVFISSWGIAAPFLGAIALTPWLAGMGLFGSGLDSLQATLFLGAAMSITAFPVLARIVEERGLTKTALGTLALSAGAIDDAVAWMVLALLLASLGAGPLVAVKALAGGGLFALVMLGFGRRIFSPLGRWAERAGGVPPQLLAIALLTFALCAWAMDGVGLHAVFGGFLLGVAMPRGQLSQGLARAVEPLSTALLIPMFFTYSGLHTRLFLLADGHLLAAAVAILLVSIAAKMFACWAAARMTGQDNPTALAVGSLMNARGMMELIIINIGLQRGIISPALFSMLALMAIATTLMTSPLFEFVYGRHARTRGTLGQVPEEETPAIKQARRLI
ncbi:cation:proton antiporter [uncultured Sphingomonas sp.]|uniref:cation:proton antiporter n=1 Tax=uncultured Sphingomonas sp. TaxID=158754 RepID=UPI0025F603F7|nr:cation:proton antiporter [uncultured Sphingomonas sp.]